MKLLITITLMVVVVIAEKVRYDHHRVYRIIPTKKTQIKALALLQQGNEYKFWTEPRNVQTPVDIMVPPNMRTEFQNFLKQHTMSDRIMIENVQSLIDEEELTTSTRQIEMDWTNYHKLEEIYKWLDDLAAKYPKIVKVVVGGKTYEGREIKGIEINFGTNLTSVFIEAGIHAREWISPAGTSWFINEIVEGSVDPVFKRFNYLYFPVFNPDGYEYTWTTDRLWRKTRTPYQTKSGMCYGADPNRNWDCNWGGIGSSNRPCSEVYAGPRVFSEVEMKSMSTYLNKVSRARKQDIFLSFHSYGQFLAYPWGWTPTPAGNDKIFNTVAVDAANALAAVNGTIFTVGSIYYALYPVSGSSIDWYYKSFNGTVVFVYEMRDTGVYGFILPPQFIIPCGKEHLASLQKILLDYEEIKK